MGKIKEIVFYNSAKTEKVFPVTESNSVYTTTTGKTVREELDEVEGNLTGLVDNGIVNDIKSAYSHLPTQVQIDHYVYSKTNGFKTLTTYINSANSEKAGVMSATDKVKLDSIDMDSKQDNLISGENIKTINGESILGYGDIIIQGGSGEGGLKIEKLTQAEYDALGEYSDDTLYAITDSQDSDVDLSDYYTKEEVDSKVDSIDLSGKQDNLVSGENIKTINGESILGSGDIIIEGGGADVIELTRSEYESLTDYAPDTFYVITDEDTDILSRLASIEARLNAAGL